MPDNYSHIKADTSTAPHECDGPDCPGPRNLRKLAAFDALLEAAKALRDKKGVLTGAHLKAIKDAADLAEQEAQQ